jgi:putative membrane protein
MFFIEEVENPMKAWTQMALALGLAVTVTACGGERRDGDTVMGDRDAAVGTTGVGMADRNFVQNQIELNEDEVAMGRLAQERTSNPQVREFAQTMVRDHEAALRDLRQVAAQHNIEVEARDADDRPRDYNRLTERSGAEFDRDFMDWVVDKHEEAVDDVEGKLESDNQAIRQWASQKLPTLRQHLDHAKTLRASLEDKR